MADIKEVSTNVKSLIFAYERQTSSSESLEHYEGRRRAKSIGNALSYKLFRQSNLEIHHLVDIEKELIKIEAHLNYYEVYEKDTQVAFQEQLLNLLTYIVNIDPEGDEASKQKKKDLIAETQKLFRILTSKLPVYGVHSYRSIQRSASRREESIVSSTSLRSHHERHAITSNQSHLTGAFKSEESLEYSNKGSSSVDLNIAEERPESATPPPPQITITSETSYIPSSVSKLKKFFSFRRDDNNKVSHAASPGVNRSQSLNIKTSKYTVFKKKEVTKGEEILNENDEEGEFNKHEVFSSTHINTNDENLYVEPVEEIKEFREIQDEQAHTVSVSKLKSLFEDKRKETEEGLASLSIKQPNDFRSDFNLPYTEGNLGAFRLKRTISGHYLNFPGLLRNIDIQKKADLNKSKSMSDLKNSNLQYGLKEIDIDDLSKEVDDDAADDFEHVSINIGKKDEELNNNELHEASQISHTSEEIKESQSSEKFVFGKVESLKKTFENHGSFESVNKIKEIHRIIEPIEHTTDGEPVLKVPIQLRTGFVQVDDSNQVVENGTNADDPNADIKHILHRTIDPIPNPSSNIEEAVLKLPIQLRTGFSHLSHAEEEVIEQNNDTVKSDIVEVEEPVLKIPVQLRIGMGNVEDYETAHSKEKLVEETVTSGTVEALKQTFETRSLSSEYKLESSPKLPHSEKPELRVFEMGSDFVHVSRSQKETVDGTVTKDEKLDFTLHGTVNQNVEEPVEELNQLETGFEQIINDFEDNATTVNQESVTSGTVEESVTSGTIEQSVTSGTVEALKQTFEYLSTKREETSEEIKQETIVTNLTEEPVLKVPIQLRGIAVQNHNAEEHTEETTINNLEQEPAQLSHIENEVEEINISSGTVEALKQTFEHLSTTLEASSEDIKQVLHRSLELVPNSINSNEEAMLKVPTFEDNSSEHKVTEASEENSIVEQHINGGTMNILESPTMSNSTLISSSSSHSQSQQVSSSSNVSISYSQKTSVQHTSTSHVSQKRIISSSSSSSGLSSQKYFEFLRNSGSPTTEELDEGTVTITEVDDQDNPKYKLNISQENLIDEILKETDLDKTVDEEFEKLLANPN